MHLCNHFCSGKAISITYSECEFVALDIQHAKFMHHIVVWPVWLYNIISCRLINNMTLKKKGIEHKMFAFIFSTTLVTNISHSKKN